MFIYDIFLLDCGDEIFVGDSGDEIFEREDEAYADADEFIADYLMDEFNKKKKDFKVEVYEKFIQILKIENGKRKWILKM